jgi:LPS export ABC transporter protein LptC
MGRTRLRAALLTVVAAAFAGIGVATWQNLAVRTAVTPGADVREILPDVAQRIRDFRRVKMKDGKAVWEVKADDAQYFEDAHQIVVHRPRIVFFSETGAPRAELAGAEGRLTLDGKELTAVTLTGDVQLTLEDLEVRTDAATYDHAGDRIQAPGLVTIRGKSLDVRGQGLEVDVTPRRVRLLDDVHTVLRNDAAAS